MKRSIIILFLFCAFRAHTCENIVNDEVQSVHEKETNGARSGKMVNYDDFMGELDGYYPDYNNNYDWGEKNICPLGVRRTKYFRFEMNHFIRRILSFEAIIIIIIVCPIKRNRECVQCSHNSCEIHA